MSVSLNHDLVCLPSRYINPRGAYMDTDGFSVKSLLFCDEHPTIEFQMKQRPRPK